MQSLLAGRLPFRIVIMIMIVVDMIPIGLTPSNRIMSIYCLLPPELTEACHDLAVR